MHLAKKRILLLTLQPILILEWLMLLKDAEARYSVYVFMGLFGIMAFCDNRTRANTLVSNHKICYSVAIVAALFSLLVTAANYKIVLNISPPFPAGNIMGRSYKTMVLMVMLLGGFTVAWNLLSRWIDTLRRFRWRAYSYSLKPWKVMSASMLGIVVIDLIVLLFCKYPGNLSPDSIGQIRMAISGINSNHHPFYHTILIKLMLDIGTTLFHDMNLAVFSYSVFQIFLIAVIFSFTVTTLYQIHLSQKIVILVWTWYALMPVNIMYSFTMWKDVLWGGAVLLFITASFRELQDIGGKVLNLSLICIGGMAICLLRSNGLFVFVIICIAYWFIFRKRKKQVCVILLVMLVFSWVLKHPVLDGMGVTQPDAIEALSIPAQQIARVVADGGELTLEQETLLNQIIDITKIVTEYKASVSDPIKGLVRQKENQEYLIQHKAEYMVLWLQLGAKYPVKYLEAWIDQTKGYWNAGYNYWIYETGVYANNYGVERTVFFPTLDRIFEIYRSVLINNSITQLFFCIGVYTWVVLALFYVSIIRKNRVGVFLTASIIAIIVSLLVATPVYSEFRYVYAVVVSTPFLMIALFANQEPNNKD